MTRWWIVAAFGGYLLITFVVLSLCRAAGLADEAMFDWEHDEPSRPCPMCGSSDVFVDADDVCFCPCCLASYPLAHVEDMP